MSEAGGDRAALARAVAAETARVPGVARLTGDSDVEAATYYPGGKILGVVVRDEVVSVHLVASALPLRPVVEKVRAAAMRALESLGASRQVDVAVEDLELGALDWAGRRAALATELHPGVVREAASGRWTRQS